jgi:hypothetical protein
MKASWTVQPRDMSQRLKRTTSRNADQASAALIQVFRRPNLMSRLDRSHGFAVRPGFDYWNLVHHTHENIPGQMATAPLR